MKKILTIFAAVSGFSFSAAALDLEEGLNIVFSENPTLQAVKNDLEIKQQQRKQALSGFMPDVTANYALERTRVNPDAGSSDTTSPSTGSINLVQPLFTGGATLANFKAAKYNEQSAERNFLSQQQNVLSNAARAYLTVITAKEVYEFNKRKVATNTEEMKRVEQRFNLGDITLPELKEFEARLSGYKAEKEAAYGDLLSAKSEFINIFGRSAESLSWPEITPELPSSLDDTLNLARENNPDILQQKLLLDATSENIKVARSSFMPTVNAVASWSDSSNTYGNNDSSVKSIGVQASLPLFAGGENKSKYTQSKIEKMQAEENLKQQIRDIELSASNAYNNILVQKQRVLALNVSLESFRTTADAVEKQEAAGEASIIDVLDARDDEFSAEVDLQLAKQALVLAQLELLSSIGKFTHDDIKNVFDESTTDNKEVIVPEEEMVEPKIIAPEYSKQD